MTDQEKSEMTKAFYDMVWNAAVEAAADEADKWIDLDVNIAAILRRLKK